MCEQSLSVESVLQKMQSSLACTICLDLLNSPMTTKCGHTFCKLCLDRLLQGSRSPVPCPLCITTVITKRSAKQNKKIASLVNAVRNVISSIKKDCGVEEPNKDVCMTSNILPIISENNELEETTIRRGTRQREQVSFYMSYSMPSKRMSGDRKGKNGSNETPTSTKSNSSINTRVKRQPENEKEDEISDINHSQYSLACPSSKIQKVEQWLNKNESIQFSSEKSENQKDQEIVGDIHNELELQPTQIFNLESKPLKSQTSPLEDIRDDLAADQNFKSDFPSQASTIIFKSENVQNKHIDDMTYFLGDLTEKNEENDHEEEAVQDEVGSEKENKNNFNIDNQNNKKGVKRVLSEPNSVTKTRKITEKSQNVFSDTERKGIFESVKPYPETDVDLELENLVEERKLAGNEPFIVKTANEKTSKSGTCDPKQPNSKGHNIRFASEIKPKLLESLKPSKLMTRSKTKKSPGWSCIEGARKDLRSKHTSLDITGGELKLNASRVGTSKLHADSSQEYLKPPKLMTRSKTKKSPGWSCTEGACKDLRSEHTNLDITGSELKANASGAGTSKLNTDSSQESVIIIEEHQSPVSAGSIPNVTVKSEYPGKVTSVVASLKSNNSVSTSNTSIGWRNNKTENLLLNTKEKDKNSYELDTVKEFKLAKNISNVEKHFIKEIVTGTETTGLPESNENEDVTNKNNIQCADSQKTENVDPSKNESTSNCLQQVKQQNVCIKERVNMKSAEHYQGSPNGGRLSRKSLKGKEQELITSDKVVEKKMEPANKSIIAIKSDLSANVSISNTCNNSSLPLRNNEIVDNNETSPVCNSPAMNFIQEKKEIVRSSLSKNVEDGKMMTSMTVSVPFLYKGNLSYKSPSFRETPQRGTVNNSSCHHNIPCDLFQAIAKYSEYLIFHSLHNRCFSVNRNEQIDSSSSCTLRPSGSHALTLQKCLPAAPEINTESFIPQNCPVNFPPKDQTMQNDRTCLLTSQAKENLCAMSQSPSLEDDMILNNDASLFTKSLSENKEFINRPVNAENSQNTQFSESVLHDREPEILKCLKPSQNYESHSIDSTDVGNKLEKGGGQDQTPSICISSQKEEKTITQNFQPFVGNRKSPSSSSKASTSSPINYKRKPLKVLYSSDSSSEDELKDVDIPVKRRRITSLDSSNSRSKLTPSLDSEEMRDFDRYDDNVWKYFRSKSENEDGCLNTVNHVEEEIETENDPRKNEEKESVHGSDEEDTIPGTAEVMKNIESDLSLIRSLRQKRKNVLSDTESEADTVDLCTQDSVVTASSANELSASTKDLFKKCNVSLNLAREILNNSSENIAENDGYSMADTLKKMTKADCSKKGATEGEDDDFGNESHSSAFSTQSIVISTQQRNKVQDEVETLKKKILALEEEMKRKEATLETNPDMSSKGNLIQCDAQLIPVAPGTEIEETKNENAQRDSDLDSEELFRSASCAIDQTTSLKKSVLKPMTVICTGLSQPETAKVHSFVDTLCGSDARVLSKWSKETTHVIVKTDDDGLTERTLKYLFGVANGAWIISLNWVTNSLRSSTLLPEIEYEALDCTGAPGPRRGRLISTPLFEECQFSLIPPFEDVTPDQLTDLIKIAGGTVVKRFNESKSGLKLFVGNAEEPEKNAIKLASSQKRSKITVAHDWLIECIGMCCLVSLSNYIIGSPPSASDIIASGVPSSLMYETQDFLCEDV